MERMIRINVISFLESEEIISWTTLQGIKNSKFTVSSMILVQIMLCVDRPLKLPALNTGEHLNTDLYHNL